MKISGRLLGVVLLLLMAWGCTVPEIENLKAASGTEEGYRAWNELIETLSRIPSAYRSNPYYTLLGKGIRADWAGNYREAEEAFREGMVNPAYFQTEYALPHRPEWILIFQAYLANALFRQGKIEEAIQNYSVTEPTFGSMISRRRPGSDDEKGWKIFAAYHCKYYGQALEKSGDTKRAMEIYRKSFRYGASEVSSDITRLEGMEASRAQSLQEFLRQAERAEQNGQLPEALTHYRAALSASALLSGTRSINPQISQKTIAVARKLDPPPAIPEEARRHAAFASLAVKEAKDPSGYEKAVAEYLQAVCLAPWWADLYYNLGMVQEQRSHFREAAETFKLYLVASPQDPQAQVIKNKIYELEYKAEKK
jgi:tetratricopeptide (TPR) repeat protein